MPDRFIPVFKPSIGPEEIQAVSAVLQSGWIGTGPETEKFEQEFGEFLGTKYVVGLNSATAGLHLALILANVGPGDEVISPSFTFIAVNHAILQVGAKPVFADIDRQTLCIDPANAIEKITPKTKAIIVVHHAGHPVDIDPLIPACRKKRIVLVEDASHATGAEYKGKKVGTLGDLAVFSFAAIKNIGTPDSGALTTNNKKLANRAKWLRWSGIDKSTWQRSGRGYSWQYNVKEIGFKYPMNDVAAAIARVQLKKLAKTNALRRKIVAIYNNAFDNLTWLKTPIEKGWARSVNHSYWVKVKKRNEFIDYLKKNGIATTVHYYPNHLYKLYARYRIFLPVTENIWKEIVNLPLFPDLTEREVEKIIKTVKKFPYK